MLKQLLIALLLGQVPAKVNKWCKFTNHTLWSYSNGVNSYESSIDAIHECEKRSDCFGLTKEPATGSGVQAKWRLHKDWKLRWKEGYTSRVPCVGLSKKTRTVIGLKSIGGKFLTDTGETIENTGGNYGEKQKFVFHQHGENSGFLFSEDGKKVLVSRAGAHELIWEWEYDWRPNIPKPWFQYRRGGDGFFTLHKNNDRIAFQTMYGKWITANYDGNVTANTGVKTEKVWFQVYPPSTVENIECKCPDRIDGSNYFLANITYGEGTVKSYSPELIGLQYIDNADSSSEQSTEFSVSEEVTQTSSFTHTAGIEVAVGTEFKCGVPLLAEGSISVEVTVGYEFSYNTEKSVTKSLEAEYSCVAAPGTIVQCKALLYKYKVHIPFTQTWQHRRVPSCACQNSGVYTDLQSTEMRLVVDEL